MNDFGPKIINYIKNKEWKVSNMSNFNLNENDIYEDLRYPLDETNILSFLEKYKITWDKNSSGEFTVKSIYNSIIGEVGKIE